MNNQRGAVLITALVIVVLLAFLSVSLLYRTTTSAQLITAHQDRLSTEQVARNVIEYVLSDVDNLVNSASTTLTIPAELTAGYTVTVGTPVCVHAQAAAGYSLTQSIVPETVYWEVDVSVVDTITSAVSGYRQVVKFNFTAGSCT
ncbi:hypothetical protein [uncultured Umboniibacter sp.]|uniref:hypothetical protein n=1 Tax=uncultured Umboniibacter sp. TaxID=1798917 RepID=UPI002637BDD9|nr:hypothetical protein [uncultured Umboniibacter sp.]